MDNIEHQRKYLQKYNDKAKRFRTKEEKQEVIDLYLQGVSSPKLAKIFNCSKPVILKVLKNTLKRRATDYQNHRCRNQYGEANTAWKGGIKTIYDRIRGLTSYWAWRKSVLDRDANICQICKSESNLQVHHITTLKKLVLSYCKNNNLKILDLKEADLNSKFFYKVSNGITYCKPCHKDYHKKFGR